MKEEAISISQSAEGQKFLKKGGKCGIITTDPLMGKPLIICQLNYLCFVYDIKMCIRDRCYNTPVKSEKEHKDMTEEENPNQNSEKFIYGRIHSMARFTLPRDLYYGKGSLEVLKTLKGKKAIVVVGGGSMKRFGF